MSRQALTGLAVYVHVPFCTIKCGYCDFNAYAGMDGLKDSYVRAVVGEIHAWGRYLEGRPVTSLAFGGGTPGEMPAAGLAEILQAVRDCWFVEPGAEISLEANPGTSSTGYFRRIREAGVNRLSLGAQSFDPSELAFLDRIHSPEAIEASFRNAREAGFASVSLDLIYGLPGQSLRAWMDTLRRAVDLDPDHLSCYGLTVEPGTLLAGRVDRGLVEPLDPDLVADMYEAAGAFLRSAGYAQYELSNWAKSGHESRHNTVYWTDRDYLGAGAGAHGYLAGIRYENHAHPRTYIDAARGFSGGRAAGLPPGLSGPAVARSYVPDRTMAMSDFIALRLRLVSGFAALEFDERFGVSLEAAVGDVLEEGRQAGVLAWDGRRVALTERGRLLHGEIAARILAHLDRPGAQSALPPFAEH